MTTRTCCLATVLAWMTLCPSPAQADRPAALAAEADLCTGLCRFPICVTGDKRPAVSLCSPSEATLTLFANDSLTGSFVRDRAPLRLTIRGTKVRLYCISGTGACQGVCDGDNACLGNGPLSRCVGGRCLTAPECLQ